MSGHYRPVPSLFGDGFEYEYFFDWIDDDSVKPPERQVAGSATDNTDGVIASGAEVSVS